MFLLKTAFFCVKMLLSLHFHHFQVANFAAIDGETQQGLHSLPPLFTCRTGVHREEIPLLVIHHFQYMTMSANKQIDPLIRSGGFVALKHRNEPRVIPSRIASNMGHQHIHSLYAKTIELAQRIAHIARVHVAIYRTRGLELPQGLQHFRATYIAGVPDLIYVLEMLQYALIQQAVGIA